MTLKNFLGSLTQLWTRTGSTASRLETAKYYPVLSARTVRNPATASIPTSDKMALLAVVIMIIMQKGNGCLFPDTMYKVNDTSNFEGWLIIGQDSPADFNYRYKTVNFHGDTMTVKYNLGGYPRNYQLDYEYICQEEMDSNKFLVKKVQKDEEIYMCVQFVQRDLNVIQLKLANLIEDVPHCHDGSMILQDSPLYFYHDSFWVDERIVTAVEHKTCPLEGGFMMTWFNESGIDQCKNSLPVLKFENECVIGDGIQIHHNDQHEEGCDRPRCTKHAEEVTRKYLCFAHWTEGIYTFMVLLNKYSLLPELNQLPCVRFVTDHGASFAVDWMMDGRCPSYPDIPIKDENHIAMHFTRYNVPSICSDESPSCKDPDVIQCKKASQKGINICRDTCKMCEPSSPFNITLFPPAFQGEWIRDMPYVAMETWVITGSTITIPSYGTYENLGETECSSGLFGRSYAGLNVFAKEFALLGSFNNGCSPRTLSISMAIRSKSVLSYKISSAVVPDWSVRYDREKEAHLLTDNSAWWCMDTDYRIGDPPLYDLYRRHDMRSFNLVKKENPTVFPCGANFTTADISIWFYSGLECEGKIKQNSHGILTLKFDTCLQGKEHARTVFSDTRLNITKLVFDKNYIIECLASYRDYWFRNYFITKSEDFHEVLGQKHSCWVSSTESIGTFHVFPSGTCDSTTNRKIHSSRLNWKDPILSLTMSHISIGASCGLSFKYMLLVFVFWLFL